MSKTKIYWLCQVIGWSLYGLLQIVLYAIAQQPDVNHVVGEVLLVLFYISTTHFIRYILISRGWLVKTLSILIPRLIGLISVLSLFNFTFLTVYTLLLGELSTRDFMLVPVVLNYFGPFVIYTLWTILYVSFYYFESYNNSLKYEAAAREIELRNLRSQLNPHFMFNALNSIRALVDENPAKAKVAITQLSNILRNSLAVDRQRLISFSDELTTIKDYLALESIRYEERLKTVFEIEPQSEGFMIPPLMIQTLVENGIKHGISTLKNGGVVHLKTIVVDNALSIEIRNSGQLVNGKYRRNKGFGINNTKKRLELIYGNQASFEIRNETNDTVLTKINIPRYL
ncbi:sensor histidine kinase [Marinoscillum sp. MHG1-6]|uniref:sensor histidine kinase n=1 Tax=Marinoscillum sp. MHG1-6 TaxID=2959627 RepID=UPI00215723CF|nr:histidine kinase [Marinoscillum sp. MHG1-6]